MTKQKIAGLVPWLPWPLCRWRTWTEPVRAERLAALRIGLGLCILLDILTTYAPHVHDLYGPDSLSRVGDRDVFWYVGRPGNYAGDNRDMASWYWSIFRGFNHPVVFGFALFGSIFLSGWIICRLTERPWPGRETSPAYDGRGRTVSWGWLLGGWMATATLALLGFWQSAVTLPDTVTIDVETSLQLGAAVVMVVVAAVFLFLAQRVPADSGARPEGLFLAAGGLAAGFLLIAAWQFADHFFGWELPLDLDWLLSPWEKSPTAL